MSQPNAPEATTPRRLKRSRVLHVSGLMATASFTLAACDSSTPSSQLNSAVETASAYTSLAECKTEGKLSADQCDKAFADAQKQAASTAPRFWTKEECENSWGSGQCQVNNSGSGSFFTPLVTGFVIGQLLSDGRSYGTRPLYRECTYRYSNGSCEARYGNGYGGGYVYRDYSTGKTSVKASDYGLEKAPARVQSRTSVVSRGGFGGGGRGYGG
ncbi:DUF1190 domain-containing protein [Caulobacter mirabilis]|uniref:DUF1190 domain-containing protein n=1 Tax=Caulobacter mirabilis TaxID=69666 RepID=A0A2D2AV41_9CAUL|nr:DUF1190 domain-containing protein [Caulobacter mirabilis]ATQ41892.1 hypothetical protein CSW64_05420 [Caulobacter mirabilis]